MKLGRLIIPTIIATAIAIIAWGFFGGNNSPEVISSSLESSSKEKANTSNQPMAKIIKDKKTKKLNNKAAPASPTQSAQSSPTEKANKPLTREQLNAR